MDKVSLEGNFDFSMVQTKNFEKEHFQKLTFDNYSAHRLMGSWIIESAAYCSQILLARFYINSAQNTSVYWIIRRTLYYTKICYVEYYWCEAQ